MNDKNRDIIFNNDELTTVVTLTDEDGNDIDAEIVAAIEVQELGKEFVAAMPQDGDFEEGEVLILGYAENADGDPEFFPIEDDEEFEIASEAFNQFFENLDVEEMSEDAEALGDYMDEVEDILPGIRFDRD
ncbi:MAG: DUF1292 domain-containing protein [Clostridiaceae bacterium]|nr:DUF1292 domain-containing protein [Clostridiaceae bacterium]